MAVAAWRVQRSGPWAETRSALALFAFQLGLNVGWSALFFALRSPGAAQVEIAVLWLAIAATGGVFSRQERWAGALMVPYLVWVSYATALNLALWRLNQ
jgi:tryptophan-rich sensory protein